MTSEALQVQPGVQCVAPGPQGPRKLRVNL